MPDYHQHHPPLPNSALPRGAPNLPHRFSFTRLADDAPTISTRGQRLGNIIRNKSSSQLQDMHQHYGSIRGQNRNKGHIDEEDAEVGLRHTRTNYDEQQEDAHGVAAVPVPPPTFPLSRHPPLPDGLERKHSSSAERVLMTPKMRSQRLIGNSNPRYRWEQYWTPENVLKLLKKALRNYYSRNNFLVQQYIYIDRLLDSSLPSDLLQEYGVAIPETIEEEPMEDGSDGSSSASAKPAQKPAANGAVKVNRTKAIFKVQDEEAPLLSSKDGNEDVDPAVPLFEFDEEADHESSVVVFAIYLNFAANAILLVLKIIVTIMTSSLSVLASLVDAALDFLSTFIVWTTSRLISSSKSDTENYPVGRQRLEPLGVLVFSVIMITSFAQVAIQAFQRLTGPDHEIVQLTPAAVAIMASTVVIKFGCWLWCRLIKNSSVQALAQDAMTDVIFNIFSIIFPLVGYYFSIWFLDPLGGLLLSLYVIFSWSLTTKTHILNLTGKACAADERNILLYLTMRFAHTIKHIQDIKAYHVGDKINVEVDIVLDEEMTLRDSHDLTESLQYVLESVPGVERAFVHADYKRFNLPTHMLQ